MRIPLEIFALMVIKLVYFRKWCNRQKGKQKMLWSREGAHYVLQIRSSLFSNEWEKDWLKLEPNIYKKTA